MGDWREAEGDRGLAVKVGQVGRARLEQEPFFLDVRYVKRSIMPD